MAMFLEVLFVLVRNSLPCLTGVIYHMLGMGCGVNCKPGVNCKMRQKAPHTWHGYLDNGLKSEWCMND